MFQSLFSYMLPAWNLIKNETPAKVFSGEFCKIFKGNLFSLQVV